MLSSLTDSALYDLYLETPSTKKIVAIVKQILLQHGIDNPNLLKDLIPHLIKPGTKGYIRGMKFNSLVKEWLIGHNYNAVYETDLKDLTERPDWYLKYGDKFLVGYNQVDLWGGGAQLNRAAHYILNDSFHEEKPSYEIICVAANKPTKNTPKIRNIIMKGLSTGRLVFLDDSLLNRIKLFTNDCN